MSEIAKITAFVRGALESLIKKIDHIGNPKNIVQVGASYLE